MKDIDQFKNWQSHMNGLELFEAREIHFGSLIRFILTLSPDIYDLQNTEKIQRIVYIFPCLGPIIIPCIVPFMVKLSWMCLNTALFH